MITAQPRLYYNTGLRVGQVIDDPSKMDSWSYRDFDVHVGLQDFFLTSFKLKADWDDVKNADYMKYGDAYYWITPTMLNENCAEIFCQLDALTSIGGPLAQEYISGTLTRAHPLVISDMSNTCEEPVKPSSILKAVIHPITFTAGGNETLTVVASTVKLDDPNVSLSPNVEQDALVFSGQIGLSSTDKYVVAIPKAPAAATSTIIGAFGTSYNSVGYGLYDAGNATVKKNLEYIRSLGLSEAILFSYTIPKNAISISKSADGHIISIYGTNSPWVSGASVSAGVSPANYTVKYYKTHLTERSFTIRGRLSGDIKNFKACEIVDPYTVQPGSLITFYYATDPQYQGTTYCAPGTYYGASDDLTRIAQAAKGLPWKDTPISIGATGTREAWNQRALALGEYHGGLSRAISQGGSIGGIVGNLANYGGQGLATNVLGLISTLTGAAGLTKSGPMNMDPDSYEKAKLEMAYAQSQVQAPELTTSPALGLQNYLDNTFDIIELRPYDNDLINIDKFYARYGYAQPNIPFTKNYLNSRPDFNYIEGHGIHIAPTAAANYGKSIVEAAEAQLNGGCTIWHVKPNQNASN